MKTLSRRISPLIPATASLLSGAILAAAIVACGSPEAATATLDGVVELDGWDGVNNLSRDGRIYFGGQPDEPSLSRLVDGAGVETVINLRHDEEMKRLAFDETEVLQSMGVRYVAIPMSPDSFSPADVDRFAEAFEGTEGNVLLHCASSNRVGGLWAAYLVRHRDVELEEAIRQGTAAGLRSPSMIEATRRVAEE